MGSIESDKTEWLHFHFSLSCIGEGNGNPLQCSCLENPRDGGAWWAAVYGVAQSRTRLKRLSSSSSSSLAQSVSSEHTSIMVKIYITNGGRGLDSCMAGSFQSQLHGMRGPPILIPNLLSYSLVIFFVALTDRIGNYYIFRFVCLLICFLLV